MERRPMATKLEEVSRAIWEARRTAALRSGFMLLSWDEEAHELREHVRAEAKAALQAMRNMTDKMREAFIDYAQPVGYLEEGYNALIDAALSDKEPGQGRSGADLSTN